ncbi:MAG: substrate-binding domain-containing protein [Bacteroidales bacterium]|nr:substrate-binding domain-containing protein [Bacteroidales bacterium]
MNRNAVTLLFAMIVLAFTSCQDSLKIGFSVGDFSSDRMSQEPAFFEEEIVSLGATALFEYGYGDPVQQLEQARSLIASGIEVLLVFPADGDNWAEVVEEAHEAGVKVIAYERMLTNADIDYYFSFYNEDVGRQQAQYTVARRPQGNYILLGGPVSDNNSLLFMKGQKEILQPYIENGDINILLEKHLDTWNSIDAYNEMQSFLEENEGITIDAILAANDELAGGCIMALDMLLGEWDIIITGQDASLGGLQNILDGKQSMTVYKPIANLATTAAQSAVKLARGGEITIIGGSVNNGFKDVPSVLLETVVVDETNIRETVIADGFISEDQLTFMTE